MNIFHSHGNFATVRYGTEKIDGLDIFYREAGDPSQQPYEILGKQR